MKRIFYPNSIAVVGASTDKTNLARNIIQNLLDYGFKGSIYPVGRSGGELLGLEIRPDIESLPASIDFAAILTPASTVPDFMRQCIDKGAKGFWIGSGGFSEFSEEGAELQKRLVETARAGGARFVGPNCFGVINNENGLCLPFGRIRRLPAGGTSVLAQSGGVGISYLQDLSEEGVGINKFASLGNKADVDEVDLLEYLGTDEGTKVICLYLESMSRGREFIETAAKVSKPIILHKANVHALTGRIARTHTASIAVDDAVLDAAVKKAGVIRVGSVGEMVEAAKVFRLPAIKGRRLAVLSRSGGHAVIAADECARLGFELPDLPAAFLERARSRMRAGVVSLGNPLDLGDLYDVPFYSEMMDTACSLDYIDGVLVLFTYVTAMGHDVPVEMLNAAKEISEKHGKPIVFCLISWADVTRHTKSTVDYPVFTRPEEALSALRHSYDHGLRSAGKAALEPLDSAAVPAGDARRIVAASMERGETLISYDALRAVREAGIEIVNTCLASDADMVRSVAAGMGSPLVLKIQSRDIAHKSDAGGVVTGVGDPQEAVARAVEMMDRIREQRPGASIDGFILQETAPAGVEMFIGAGRDESFGPFVTVGLGGIFVEVFKDAAIRPAPLSEEDAVDMITSLKGYPLLEGVRGRPACDFDALCDAIVKVGRLIAAIPEIRELDINPIIVYPNGLGVLAVDARMTLGKK